MKRTKKFEDAKGLVSAGKVETYNMTVVERAIAAAKKDKYAKIWGMLFSEKKDFTKKSFLEMLKKYDLVVLDMKNDVEHNIISYKTINFAKKCIATKERDYDKNHWRVEDILILLCTMAWAQNTDSDVKTVDFATLEAFINAINF